MDKKIHDNYIKAGQIAMQAQKKSKELLVEGAVLYDVAEEVESFIVKKGGGLAFPINLSLNENAAHQTPAWKDKTTLKKSDVLKVDIGVEVEGYIADSAFTLNLDKKHEKQIKDAELALENALKVANIGVKIGDIGKAIETTANSTEFKVVNNLSGHGLDKYTAHAPPSIPNVEMNDTRVLEEGKAYAIEPFLSTGEGYVVHSNTTEIFELSEERNTRHSGARKILAKINEDYGDLPFAERWLYRDVKISEFELKVGLKTLLREKILTSHPILHDKPGSIVTQAENTVIIYKGKSIKLLD